MFTPISNTQATGDTYVFTRDGKLVMTNTGVGFIKLLIIKLKKMLAAANSKILNETLLEKKPERTLIPITTPGSPTENDSRSSTDESDDEGPPTPTDIVTGADNLKNLIASYTGPSETEILDDANIGDLGVDSLAAVELAKELQTRFGKEIAAEDLMMSNYASLSQIFISAPPKKLKPAQLKYQLISINQDHRQFCKKTKGLADDLRKHVGAPINEIRESAALQDLVADSLSAVELKSELEDAFSIEIEDDDLSLESTVKEVLSYLGIEEFQPQSDSVVTVPNINASSTNISQTVPGSVPVILANPMDIIEECQTAFEPAAKKLGYINWSEVGPKQDELLVAYIAEAFKTLHVDLCKLGNGQELPEVDYLPRHLKVMNRYMEILEKNRIIKKKGGTFVRTVNRLSKIDSNDLLQNLLRQYPAYAAESRLMELTGPKLADCLIGKTDPIALMFGNSAAQKVMEDYYNTFPMLGTLTEQLVNFIRRIAINTTSDGPIKILEVGAGFGGTTTRLADVLHAVDRQVKYTFTDISPSLLKIAKPRERCSIKYERQFDIVIGTNCVYATTNKISSTRYLKKTLRDGGFMILSEVTELVDWYDVVYGLLDGWWLGNDVDDPLQPPEFWMDCFEKADMLRLHSNTQCLLIGSTENLKISIHKNETKRDSKTGQAIDTVRYKVVDGVEVLADIFLPVYQKSPLSLDYRLCPEVDLINGPMEDIRDAYSWAQTKLQGLVDGKGIKVDPSRIVVIGWSTGDHLAMTTAWTTKDIGLKPPFAILSNGFRIWRQVNGFGILDNSKLMKTDLDISRASQYAGRKLSLDTIRKSLSKRPITNYNAEGANSTSLEGNGLSIMLNGISDHDWRRKPDPERIASISPMAQLRSGKYTTPTFLIRGGGDEIVPYHTAKEFATPLGEHGVRCGFLGVPGVKHIHDLSLRPGREEWKQGVELGYEFLFEILSRL
ncbi:hypothetical protein EAF04_005931 [Stromatinia cepivora]|nr:hypothetical protein EAF04_005931 [Stromatinia cepivora]